MTSEIRGLGSFGIPEVGHQTPPVLRTGGYPPGVAGARQSLPLHNGSHIVRPISIMQKNHGIALVGCALLVAGGLTPEWGWLMVIPGAVLLLGAGVNLIRHGAGH